MTRQRIPGLTSETERALLGIISGLEAKIAALGAGTAQRGVVTSSFFARPGEMIACEPPATGIAGTLPAPSALLRDAAITLLKLTTGPIRLDSTDGKVNALDSYTLDAIGSYRLTCDGSTGWFVAPGASSAALDAVFGSTRGSILIRGANGWQTLAPGTDALPLVANGVGADPAYEKVAPAGLDLTADYAWTGAHSFGSTVTVGTGFSATLAAQANNLAIGAVSVVRLALNGAQNLTGMVPAVPGQVVLLMNVDSADSLTIVDGSLSSSALNRFDCPSGSDYVLPPQCGVLAYYNTSPTRWHLLAR